jgi:hypothetical protein
MKQNFGSLQNEQDWQTHGKHDYNEERKNCNKYNQECKRGGNKKDHLSPGNCQRLLQ